MTIDEKTRDHLLKPVQECNPEAPPELCDIIHRCLSYDPNKRPERVGEVHGVLDQLVARSGVPNITSAQLFRQWFDTQNPKPGLADRAGPHCDDFMTDGSPSFNGLPRRCPTFEGALAATPFTSGEYFPIALVNRFDQAPADGSNCGQFRLIFARAMPLQQRLHIIMEPVLRNPNPASGLAGCRAVAQFWAGLTNVDSQADRRAKLESFFFDGIAGMPPVIDPDNFTAASGGG